MKIGINSYDGLPLEKTENIQNEIIFIRLIFNNNYNNYHRDLIFIQINRIDIFHAYLHSSIEISRVKEISIKNRAYYFFDEKINIKTFDPNNINIDENHAKIFSFTTLVM